jgi:hypothetical protein
VSTLVLVDIETTLGVHYTFPDMDRSIFEKVVANDSVWRSLGSIVLTNASGACLVVPSRIIQTIKIDGEVWWKTSPA